MRATLGLLVRAGGSAVTFWVGPPSGRLAVALGVLVVSLWVDAGLVTGGRRSRLIVPQCFVGGWRLTRCELGRGFGACWSVPHSVRAAAGCRRHPFLCPEPWVENLAVGMCL